MATSTVAPTMIGLRQVPAIFSKSSVVIKTITVSLCLLYVVSLFVNTETLLDALSVTPVRIFPPSFRVWTLFTHAFLELHIWLILVDVVFLVVAAKLVEPLFGALEMLIFFFVVNTGAVLLSSVIYMLMYLAVFSPILIFDSYFHGLSAYVSGIAVVLKQTMGDQDFFGRGILRLKVKDLPLLILITSSLLRVLRLIDGESLSMYASGILVSWLYLRFFQRHASNKGDMADTFRFATFFPEIVQPPIAIVSNTVYSFLVRVKLCKKQIRKYDVGAPSPININLPGSDPADAERRRQIALKALNERLGAVEEQTAWPSMDDQPPSTPGNPAGQSLTGDQQENGGKVDDKVDKKNGDTAVVNMSNGGEEQQS